MTMPREDEEVGLVFCNDYNGRSALFMMKKSDSRYDNGNYEHVSDGRYSNHMLFANGKTYRVFNDWSVKEV